MTNIDFFEFLAVIQIQMNCFTCECSIPKNFTEQANTEEFYPIELLLAVLVLVTLDQ